MKNLTRGVSTAVLLASGWLAPGIEATASEVEHEAEHAEQFAVALFVGQTEVEDEWENTLGLEATYHINHRWSVFALAERSDRKQSTTLVLAGLGLHPYKNLVLIAGLGRKDPENERENAARLGVAWEFELGGGWGIEPSAGVDFIEIHDESEVVLGAYILKQF